MYKGKVEIEICILYSAKDIPIQNGFLWRLNAIPISSSEFESTFSQININDHPSKNFFQN